MNQYEKVDETVKVFDEATLWESGHKEIEKGISDIKSDNVYSIDAVDAEMKREFDI